MIPYCMMINYLIAEPSKSTRYKHFDVVESYLSVSFIASLSNILSRDFVRAKAHDKSHLIKRGPFAETKSVITVT